MNVITGETGAGKSIMLGALGLLLGNRADTRVLWEEAEKCISEAEFDVSRYGLQQLFEDLDVDYDERTVIRREIGSNGKSRAFINDTPVTLDVLKAVASRLMDIHSQHETLELGSSAFQLHLIDTYASNQKVREDYAQAWTSSQDARRKFESLEAEGIQLKQESDFVRFQLDELTKANLEGDEQEKLESELKIQENAEDIKARFNAILDMMSGEQSIASALATIRTQLSSVSAFSPVYMELFTRIDSLKIEMDDLAREVEHEESKIEFDHTRLETLNDRLSTIYKLLQKHRVQSVTELIGLREGFAEKANKATNLDAQLEALKEVVRREEANLFQKADALSKTRAKAFVPIAKQITELLKELGIPDAQVRITAEEVKHGPMGKDRVEIYFSANKGIPPQPLQEVASGGEFARLMFAVKYVMAEKTAMPTLVLDEIDTGVSGEIAMSLGRLMKEMSGRHQVIAISHLPQIAAKGEAHYFVFKDNSSKKAVTTIRKLSEQERVDEIAKMIGGARPTATAIENARELINR